jgi:hypothetical protein
VHRLRQTLATASLRTVQTGYQLDLDGHELDAERFASGVTLARRHITRSELVGGVEAFRDATHGSRPVRAPNTVAGHDAAPVLGATMGRCG